MSNRLLLTFFSAALLVACAKQEAPKAVSEAATQLAEPTQIGSTAPSVGSFADIEERSLSYRHQLDPGKVGHYGVGEPATPEMIAGWDIDIRPDGHGLPSGSGTPEIGEPLYEDKCAECHGSFGEGEGRWPKLAGRDGLVGDRPEKTVGSYWPYASTLWDYIHRAMPFFEPQSLSDNEVYAITAYVLYLNEIIEYEVEVNQGNLASIEMPNREGFYMDPRPDVTNVACMENCKNPDEIKITWDSTELGVTPVDHLQNNQSTNTDIAEEKEIDGAQVYEQACKICHDAGLAGAPIIGSGDMWVQRTEQGRDVLIDHAINGFRGAAGMMPPRGGQSQLSDEEVSAAVDYMLQRLN